MKLILAIVSNEDSGKVQSALTKEGFYTTKLATTGGFLMSGNTTLICGTEDERVDHVMEILALHCKKRTQVMATNATCTSGVYSAFPIEVQVGGATVFVLDVEQFKKL